MRGTVKVQVRPFKTTITGDFPLKGSQSITTGEKLRLIIIPDTNEENANRAKNLEILNPLEMQILREKLPDIDNTKIVYFDITIPNTWIRGKY